MSAPPLKVNPAVIALVAEAGFVSIVGAPGAVVSTVQVCEATVVSTFPKASVALTSKVLLPAVKLVRSTGEVQFAKDAEFKRHWMLATPDPPPSDAVKAKLALDPENEPGVDVKLVSGAVLSTVQE